MVHGFFIKCRQSFISTKAAMTGTVAVITLIIEYTVTYVVRLINLANIDTPKIDHRNRTPSSRATGRFLSFNLNAQSKRWVFKTIKIRDMTDPGREG